MPQPCKRLSVWQTVPLLILETTNLAKLDGAVFMTTTHVSLNWQRRGFHLWPRADFWCSHIGWWDRVTGRLMQWNRAPSQGKGIQRLKKPDALPLSLRLCLVIHTQLRIMASSLDKRANRRLCVPLPVYAVFICEVGIRLTVWFCGCKSPNSLWLGGKLSCWLWAAFDLRQSLKQQQTLLIAAAARFKEWFAHVRGVERTLGFSLVSSASPRVVWSLNRKDSNI